MKTIELKGTLRESLGKKGSKQVRKNESVPCVLYGNGIEGIHFSITERDLEPVIYTPNVYLINLDLGDKKYTGIMCEIQFHPVTDMPIHVDFMNVVEDKPIAIELPVILIGNSEGVKQGGKLQLVTRKVKVSAFVKDLPDNLTIDVSNLGLGKTIYVKELGKNYPDLKVLTPESVTICRIKATRASREQANETTAGKK
ncbi:MAG: 50S ribosomal protein L25/general stress protein Ctc [Prevotellaceae bacterium]|jgi:large subunit ribosomal protein L25|nr:50S ribosomal protein L25/general stress protein Ctc [Prevotellaceae bacterium]